MPTPSGPSISPNVGTKFIRGNQLCCFLSFFLISWIVATVSLLVANKRRDRELVLLVVTFFATQGAGALFFGASSDMKGRKVVFQFLCLLVLGGLIGVLSSSYPLFERSASGNGEIDHSTAATVHPIFLPGAFSGGPPYWILLTSISVIGAAVGGFYSVVGILLVESVECKTRVLNVASMFSMQGWAYLLVRCVAAVIFYYYPNVLVLEIHYLLMSVALLMLIPLIIMAYAFTEETSVFLSSHGLLRQPTLTSSDPALIASLLPRQDQNDQFQSLSFKKYFSTIKKIVRPSFWDIVGTALPWLIFDCLFYGDFVFHYLLIQRVKGFYLDSQENHFAIVVSFVSLLGYLLGLILVTRITPKLFQILGFTVLAFVFFGLALSLYSISHAIGVHQSISEFLGASLLYDCYFRFFNFIPNLTTFLIPLDAFPTKGRGFFFGLAVFGSRFGAFIGMILNWLVMEPYFSRASMLLFGAGLCVIGAAVTRATTPHVLPSEEDLLNLDMILLTRINPSTLRRRSSTQYNQTRLRQY